MHGLRLRWPGRRPAAALAWAIAAAAVAASGGFAETSEPSAGGGGASPGAQLQVAPEREQGQAIDELALWSAGTKLRGANVYQRRVYPALDGEVFLGPGPLGPPYVQRDFDRLAALGANYVNISHPGLYTETPPYLPDPAVEANLDRLLAMAAEAGLFAVISFRTGPGRSEFAIFEGQDWFPSELVVNAVWTSQEAQVAWADMWRYVASRYRDDPVVVGYDLMVEPNGASTTLGIWDPAEFYPAHAGSLADWNQLFPRLTAAIREVDPATPVLVSAMSYGNVDWLPYLQPSGDPRTVYTVHDYEPFEYTHQGPRARRRYPGVMRVGGRKVRVDRAWLNRRLHPVDDFRQAHGVPVAVNEFGLVRWAPGAARYFRDLTALFERRGLNHALWLWEASHPPLAEADDFNFRHGPNPANHADVARSRLLTAIRSSWSRNAVRP